MKPVVVVALLCVLASVLAAVHQKTCQQDYSTTSRCDVVLGVPVIVLLAVASGVSALAILALSGDSKP